MKHILMSFLFFWCSTSALAQTQLDTRTLLDYFEEIDLPISIIKKPKFREKLPYEMVLNHFFNGDAEKMKYKLILVNEDDNSEKEVPFVKEIIPCYYFIRNEKVFVIYKYLSDGETIGRIGVINKNGMEESHITIWYLNEESTKYIISKNYGDIIFTFEYIELFNRDSTNNATQINIKSYTVDYDNNKFVLSNEKTIYSPIEMYQFDKYKEEPDSIKAQDPFYIY